MRNVVELFLAANTILPMHKWNHTCSLLVYVISVVISGRQHAQRFSEDIIYFKKTQWLNDKTLLLNSVIAKYCDLSVSRRSNICLSLQLLQLIDLLATDKSRYVAQPHPIIANYLFKIFPQFWLAKSTRVIQHNQLLMTNFGRILCLTKKWCEKCSPLQVKALVPRKPWDKVELFWLWKKMADISLISRVRTTGGTRWNNS